MKFSVDRNLMKTVETSLSDNNFGQSREKRLEPYDYPPHNFQCPPWAALL